MANTIVNIRDRVGSICAGEAFGFTLAQTPFDFDNQPTGTIDSCFRVTSESDTVIGGFNYSEERTDKLDIWIARKQASDPNAMYRQFLIDAAAVRDAVIRDGLEGDYFVPADSGGFSVQHAGDKEYAVLKLSVGVNYEATIG